MPSVDPSRSSPSDYLDLTANEIDFKRGVISVVKSPEGQGRLCWTGGGQEAKADGGTLKLFRSVGKWASAVKSAVLRDSSSLHSVAKEIEAEAEVSLKQIRDAVPRRRVQVESKPGPLMFSMTLSPDIPRDQKIAVLEPLKRQIDLLVGNLERHNVVIEEANSALLLGKVSPALCACHEKSLNEALACQKEITASLEKLQVESASEITEKFDRFLLGFDKQIRHFQHSVTEEGMPVDRSYIETTYLKKMRKWEGVKIPPRRERELQERVNRFQEAVNVFYLATLYENIQSGKVSLPIAHQTVLNKLELEGDFDAHMSSAKKEVLKVLWDVMNDPSVSKVSPVDLVQDIQSQVIQKGASHLFLNSPDKQKRVALLMQKRVALLIGKIRAKEAVWNCKVQENNKSIKGCMDVVLEKANELYRLSKSKENELKTFSPSLSFHDFLRCVFSPEMQLNRGVLDLSEEDFNLWEQRFDAALQEQEERWFGVKQDEMRVLSNSQMMEFIAAWSKNIEEEYPAWLDPDRGDRRCFAYSQSVDGDNSILGDGCCAAINFRWIHYRLRHPTEKITSEEQLNLLKERGGGSKRAVTPLDRFRQALSGMEWEKDQGAEKGHFSAITLKKNGLKPLSVYSSASDPTSFKVEQAGGFVDKFIESAQANPGEILTLGEGVVAISIAGDDGAHAIGMHVDPSRYSYQFWDVNSGWYQFKSADHMKKAFATYLERSYPGWHFRSAFVFTPIPK